MLFLPRFHGFGTNESQPASRIDRGHIPERSFSPILHLGMAEFVSRLVPFGRVAAMASQSQVADAIGTVFRSKLIGIEVPTHIRIRVNLHDKDG